MISPTRILHTSDWHLGKRLFKLDRTQEHEHFLNWIIETIKSQRIDLLLISGDIFDTPTPPHQSLELFYHFLYRLSQETKASSYIIAGNHDSGQLLEAPGPLLKHHRVKVWGKLQENPKDHWIEFNNIDICAIPFFRSYELLPHGEGDALKALDSYLYKEKTRPQILMLHHLAGIFEAAGSEQVISLSGVDSIPNENLKAFDYVALGHIHKPQRIGENIYYSGSPLPLRFSERAPKSVVILEEEEKGFSKTILPIPVFREFFSVRTNLKKYAEDISKLDPKSILTPQAEVQIELDSPQVGLIDEIKKLLDKKNIELLSYMPVYKNSNAPEKRNDKLFELSPLELFSEFYQAKFPEAKGVPADLEEDFKTLIEKVKNAPSET